MLMSELFLGVGDFHSNALINGFLISFAYCSSSASFYPAKTNKIQEHFRIFHHPQEIVDLPTPPAYPQGPLVM